MSGEMQVTVKCIHTRIPVGEEMCRRLSSVHQKNLGCTAARCTSPWRMCGKCILLPKDERTDGPVDPESGFCKEHGGVFEVIEEMEIESSEFEPQTVWLDPNDISPLPDQPRKDFDPEEMELLKESIALLGQVQPGTVKKNARWT